MNLIVVELKSLIREIGQFAVIVAPVNPEFGLRDPDDEIYLATATAGNAVLITGNIHDFAEPRYGSVGKRSRQLIC